MRFGPTTHAITMPRRWCTRYVARASAEVERITGTYFDGRRVTRSSPASYDETLARRLWEAAAVIAARGWPDDLTSLPGVGRYTARAVAAQCDDTDLPAVEVNGRRVAERAAGRPLSDRDAERVLVELGAPLRGRDRLLALMDVGAIVCRPRDPLCDECPLRLQCVTRGARVGERGPRQPRYEGSFRQRRGRVMARLRAGEPVDARSLDADALTSLVDDGLALVDDETIARLP